MTYNEAAAAIGRRVRVEGGKYNKREGTIWRLERKTVRVQIPNYPLPLVPALAPYRLHLIEEEETDANP